MQDFSVDLYNVTVVQWCNNFFSTFVLKEVCVANVYHHGPGLKAGMVSMGIDADPWQIFAQQG